MPAWWVRQVVDDCLRHTTTTIAEPPSPSLGKRLDDGAVVTCGAPVGSLDVFHGVLKMREDGAPVVVVEGNLL